MKDLLLLCLLLTVASLSLAWSPTGHMVIGEIAKERLTNNALARCTELIPVKVPPLKVRIGKKLIDESQRSGSFVTACCWADDVRSDADRQVHYIDIAFSADGTPLPPVSGLPSSVHRNIVKMLEDCVTVLKNPRASRTDRAAKLRYLLHLVGDIHQPLHAASRCTDEQPGGDRGGNDFPVVGAANLHSYWDGGVGLLKTTISRPLTADGIAKIAAIKAQVVAAYVGPVPDRANPANNTGAASGTRPTTFANGLARPEAALHLSVSFRAFRGSADR